MRICFFTLGSRGDVQPYVALGQALVRAGHEAVVCTGESFRTLVEGAGLRFTATASDLMAIAQTPEGKAVLEHPVRNLRKTMALTRSVVNPAYRKTLEDFLRASAGADCIVYHPKALGAVDIANYRGIPCVSMPPVPITCPIPEFPCLAVTTRDLGARLNRMSYQVNALAEASQIGLVNDFRERCLGLGPRKAGAYAFSDGRARIPTVYPVSPSLFPDVKSWDGHVLVPGFFFVDEGAARLPEEVARFLDGGAKPVAITFGSMPMADPARFLGILRTTLEETGNRAILLVGNSGIECESDQTILVVPSVSHQLLFPQVKGVIHHGGVGTLAAALKAGVPQMIVPFSVDQPFWAERTRRLGLGLGLAPRREAELSVATLSKALREMGQAGHKRQAAAFAQVIQAEDGVGKTVAYLEQVVAEARRR